MTPIDVSLFLEAMRDARVAESFLLQHIVIYMKEPLPTRALLQRLQSMPENLTDDNLTDLFLEVAEAYHGHKDTYVHTDY